VSEAVFLLNDAKASQFNDEITFICATLQ